MRRHLQLAGLCGILCSCGRHPPGRDFVGHYVKGLAGREFQVCGMPDTLAVVWDSAFPPETLMVFTQGPAPTQWFARLRGDTTGPDSTDSQRPSHRRLLLRKTIEIRPARKGDCP